MEKVLSCWPLTLPCGRTCAGQGTMGHVRQHAAAKRAGVRGRGNAQLAGAQQHAHRAAAAGHARGAVRPR